VAIIVAALVLSVSPGRIATEVGAARFVRLPVIAPAAWLIAPIRAPRANRRLR